VENREGIRPRTTIAVNGESPRSPVQTGALRVARFWSIHATVEGVRGLARVTYAEDHQRRRGHRHLAALVEDRSRSTVPRSARRDSIFSRSPDYTERTSPGRHRPDPLRSSSPWGPGGGVQGVMCRPHRMNMAKVLTGPARDEAEPEHAGPFGRLLRHRWKGPAGSNGGRY